LNTKPVDNAIFDALLQNGPTTSNELHRFVQEICPCTEKTCRAHATILADQGRIKRKNVGQSVEYSLSYDKESLDSKLSEFLDELIDDAQNPYVEVAKFFKKYQSSKKFSKIKLKKQNEIFFHGLDSVSVILRWYQLLLLMIIGGFAASDTKQKAKKLQKKYNQQLQELFRMYRKIDPSLARMIFSNVFDELYPRDKRSEDLVLV